MRKNTVLLAEFILISVIPTIVFPSVFAEYRESDANSTFIIINPDNPKQSCDADAEFTLIHVNATQQNKVNVDFEIKTSSVFVNLTKGVVGQDSVQIPKISNSEISKDAVYDIKCYENPKNSWKENKTFSVEKESGTLEPFYDLKINDKNLGKITVDPYYIGSQKITEKNSTFLVVTGADACNAYGAYRMVNVNSKPNNDEVIFEIDVSSLFFNRIPTIKNNVTSYEYHVVGIGTNSTSIEGSINGEQIGLHNDISCFNDEPGPTYEKFELIINDEGQANLNLPPIRFKN